MADGSTQIIASTYLNLHVPDVDFDSESEDEPDQADVSSETIREARMSFLKANKAANQTARVRIALLTKAAEGGHVEAQMSLGQIYAAGKGVPTDKNLALHWMIRAAEQGNLKAQHIASHFLEDQQRHSEAFEMTLWAAKQGALQSSSQNCFYLVDYFHTG